MALSISTSLLLLKTVIKPLLLSARLFKILTSIIEASRGSKLVIGSNISSEFCNFSKDLASFTKRLEKLSSKFHKIEYTRARISNDEFS